MKIWKWIIGGLGLYVGGFLGAIGGFFIGSFIDSLIGAEIPPEGKRPYYQPYSSAGASQLTPFSKSLLLLAAAVLKADGKVMQSELEVVKQFWRKNFSLEETKEAMLFLRESLQKEIPLHSVCMSVRTRYNRHVHLVMLQLLFSIAAADGNISAAEISIIEQIAGYLGISAAHYNSIKAMFYVQTDREWAYKILEITRTATNEEVKKAYRKMALKHHPDKVAQMGEDVQRAANERFLKIQEAYEAIKKERNL